MSHNYMYAMIMLTKWLMVTLSSTITKMLWGVSYDCSSKCLLDSLTLHASRLNQGKIYEMFSPVNHNYILHFTSTLRSILGDENNLLEIVPHFCSFYWDYHCMVRENYHPMLSILSLLVRLEISY